MTKEKYEIINTVLHRIQALTGEIVKEKTEYIEKMQSHIKELLMARKEIMELVDSMAIEETADE